MKEQVISTIRQIVAAEKYKLDAYFFCGSPVGKVNQSLLKACETYLEAVDNSKPDEVVTAKMIAELEAVVATQTENTTNVINNIADMKKVLENKDCLFA